jgi:hypothetical protein
MAAPVARSGCCGCLHRMYARCCGKKAGMPNGRLVRYAQHDRNATAISMVGLRTVLHESDPPSKSMAITRPIRIDVKTTELTDIENGAS